MIEDGTDGRTSGKKKRTSAGQLVVGRAAGERSSQPVSRELKNVDKSSSSSNPGVRYGYSTQKTRGGARDWEVGMHTQHKP